MGKSVRESGGDLEDTLGDGKQKLCCQSSSKHSDSGLLSIIHHGDYNDHFGIDQIMQNEFNCSIIGCGFSIAPTHASCIATVLASGKYVHNMPDLKLLDFNLLT